MTSHAWGPLATGILLSALGIVVLARERGSFISAIFCLLTWAVAVWLAGYALALSAKDPTTALQWIYVEKAAVAFIPSLTCIFTLSIVRQIERFQLLAFSTLILSGFFSMMAVWTDGFIAGVYHYPWGYYVRYGPWSIPFLVFFSASMVFNLWLLWREYRAAVSWEYQRRVQGFLIAFGAAYVGSVDYLPGYGVPIYPFGYLAVLAFFILSARTIWHCRLVEITPAFAARQILETMQESLLVLDEEGTIRIVNRAACRLFGAEEKDLLGKPLWAVAGNFLPMDRLQKALRTSVVQRFETDFSTGKDRPIRLEVSASAIKGANPTGRQTIGVVCTARETSIPPASLESPA